MAGIDQSKIRNFVLLHISITEVDFGRPDHREDRTADKS